MNNQELLFNLVNKLDSREFEPFYEDEKLFLKDKSSSEKIFITLIAGEVDGYDAINRGYREEENEELKENFYKEKGLDNCWYKDCKNKIYQPKDKRINLQELPSWVKLGDIKDWKGVYIPCQEQHKRYICLDCYTNKNHD